MLFGSCQNWLASFFLDAGLAAVLFTRTTSWPSNTKEDGIPQMMPGEQGAMPDWSRQPGGPLGIHQPVRPIRSTVEQSQVG
jgi:hypothetical protein